MGESINAFAGPYAEWRAPRSQASDVVNDVPILSELGGLSFVASQGELPTAELGGVEYVRFLFWPRRRRRGAPARQLWHSTFGWLAAALDLSGADRGTEVRWFARAYKAELDRLAAHFGSDPQLLWGMLVWAE
jgi:hypothetical protein